MKIPKRPLGLMTKIYRHVLPKVHQKLNYWKERALAIPDQELRNQALSSIRGKTFHCEGGGIYSLLAKENLDDAVSFIVAYQTISDYLDNLCDRSTSLDPNDFRALHESMHHALTPGAPVSDYYRFRKEREDGGYLAELVKTCQHQLGKIQDLKVIQPALWELEGYYSDLQVHKHVKQDERVPRLQEWFKYHQSRLPEMTWYEFSACSGSTLGIFCIVSYGLAQIKMDELVHQLKDGYFPWVQGLHILLDYFVDQDEDKQGGDLNFCFYYEDEATMIERFHHFIEQSDISIAKLPDKNFHRMINRGLLGIYLADQKVKAQKNVRSLARKIISQAGGSGLFFFVNGWLYRRLKPGI
ncbi:tetraprenyl-beta-curcumene synthase family protein [Pullulanibacillus sp. KACC 23026]|uniref:tetraprenyl-beta-curcumene synthase family protein n=1 Tax=Pullulanibacillus sp. KACC 23026 TaxID=3028315 RepID=UPI0023B1422B|nr:tetraprenyl-beta-curcumene synthase family protein [Pullulanibacillus sp. KACC 23026]WEG13845.1 tetraprenyl-beta-curcumene synthase family protein [Pullulanibacillus sp. KACC 23026]